MNLEKNIFKKHLLINVQQNILPKTMEWLRDATNALEQEDSLLNKGQNNSFLNNNRRFSKFKIPFYTFVIDRPRLFQMIVFDDFLKHCDTEAFLKFNGCFST